MEISLKDKGFIVERGFKKVISPFDEMLETRGWQSLSEHKEPSYASLVKELFANIIEKEGKRVYVRGHWVEFSREEKKRLFSLRVQQDGLKFKKQLKEPKHQKKVDLLTAGKRYWKGTKKTPFKSIARGDLIEEAKVWFYFINYVLIPYKHLSTVIRSLASTLVMWITSTHQLIIRSLAPSPATTPFDSCHCRVIGINKNLFPMFLLLP